ncbi:hypothetical protein [Fibrobacter sp. UWB5]|uniref:hypothetical protein n=1 Tax=Fibrobacter sp. UWB5 TaxID=1964360 RepID=UPI0013038495|nr:hypothetical protein [Fibrobacter sp. UWB5]
MKKKDKEKNMEKKKEYVVPQMDVFEYVVKTSLLQGSSTAKQDDADTPNVLTGGSFD